MGLSVQDPPQGPGRGAGHAGPPSQPHQSSCGPSRLSQAAVATRPRRRNPTQRLPGAQASAWSHVPWQR
eukprot:7056567-Pyramimonas_sp.AAC.1